VKKILFGGILAAAAFYYFHPEAGAARRERLSSLWSRKDTVLEAARSTSSVVAGVSQEVGDRVGTKIAGIRTEGDRSNGNTLTGAASTRSSDS
jgi:hypothetical protein